MLGFVKKDLLMIKNNLKTYALIFIVYAILGIQGAFDISSILPFFCVIFMLATFSYDDLNNWNAYAITLPNGRNNVVKSKYVTSLILILVSLILVTILSTGFAYMNNGSINFIEIISTILGTAFGTILVLAVMYPIIFKFGVEKARIAIFVIVFGLIFLIMALLKFIDLDNLKWNFAFFEQHFVIILSLAIVIILSLSYFISQKIFSKKEF